ncbi:insulinase family protein [Streptomyces sp. NBC_01268]|uniref:insulinase family protein n=1 Tax=unclassified Streptomyces TaxID=2593676 RepID=UPI002E367F1B|nr:insulinase family protein [Streptomyces sp. NBC_01268]
MRRTREAEAGFGWSEQRGDTAALALVFPAGFAAEGADRPGLAHFTEHMIMAPSGGRAEPYASLEEAGCLLEARTRRDHMTVTVSGPQDSFLDAVGTVVAHLADLERPDGTADRQAEIIRNEVLDKTRLAPQSDTWRWCVPTPDGPIGLDHDPITSPALSGSVGHAGTWRAFAAERVRLDGCAVGLAADPTRVRPEDVASLLGPRTWGERAPASAPAHFRAAGVRRHALVVPVVDDGPSGQAAALVAGHLFAARAATVHRRRPAPVRYGLFDEWFSESGPTALEVPLPVGFDPTAHEHELLRSLRAAVDPGRTTRAGEQLSEQWRTRTETASAGARSIAWAAFARHHGDPFVHVDLDLVARHLETITVWEEH